MRGLPFTDPVPPPLGAPLLKAPLLPGLLPNPPIKRQIFCEEISSHTSLGVRGNPLGGGGTRASTPSISAGTGLGEGGGGCSCRWWGWKYSHKAPATICPGQGRSPRAHPPHPGFSGAAMPTAPTDPQALGHSRLPVAFVCRGGRARLRPQLVPCPLERAPLAFPRRRLLAQSRQKAPRPQEVCKQSAGLPKVAADAPCVDITVALLGKAIFRQQRNH